MIRLVYRSISNGHMTTETIDQILGVARRNNARDGINGLMLYHDGLFLQVLEGQADVVDACYERVCQDDRHRSLYLLSRTEAKAPAFSEWRMGFERPAQLDSRERGSLMTLDEIQARLDQIGTEGLSENRSFMTRQLGMFLRNCRTELKHAA